jgi:mannose-6-phosphate isomerase-like protein (cupin superfamily)
MQVLSDAHREPFETLDGSVVRGETIEHLHRTSEEIYRFVSGVGRMRLGDQEAEVRAGDTVLIPAGVRHKLFNPGSEPLVLLCACSPPYSDADTEVFRGC